MPRLYVGGLKDAREADVQAAFAKHGNVARVDMKRGYCFVEMDDENEARDAMKDLDGTDLDGAQISVQLSKGAPRRHDGPPRGREGQGERRGERNNYSVSVENMSASTSWQDLKDFAREAGEVLYTVVYNSRGRTVGKIEYGSRNEVQDALRKLDDTRLGGSYVRLREGSPRNDRRSPSPRRHERRRSPSPRRRRSPSPRRRSPSPRRRSPSPRRRRSPSPRRRSPSPRRR